MERQYTGKDHIEAAFRREYTDRVPVRVWWGGPIYVEQEDMIKAFMHIPPDLFAMGEEGLQDILQEDTVTVPAFDPIMFVEGTGEGIELTPEEIIARTSRGAPLLEGKSAFLRFKPPDLEQCSRIHFFVETCKILSSKITDAAIDVVITGPWTMAAYVRGPENLIYDTRDDPDFVRDFVRYFTEYTKMIGAAIVETGIGILTIGDPSSGSGVISPKMFREWSKSCLQELISYLKQKGATVCLHICGKVDPIMEDMVSLEPDAISIDGPSSLKKLVEVSQKRVVAIGNVDTELFVEGTKEQIEERAKECIDIAAEGSAYILSSGCQVPGNASLENVKHFLEFAQQYGHRYYERLKLQ